MVEGRTAAFEAYLKELAKKDKNVPAKGKKNGPREGKLIVSPNELLEEEDVDSDFENKKSSADEDAEL